MSKITFRADEDLVERLEACDTSKSEVMRRALRAYLDDGATVSSTSGGVDDAITDRVDQLIAERLNERLPARSPASERDINVNVRVDGVNPGEAEVSTSGSADPGAPSRGSGTGETDVDGRKTPDPRSGSTEGNTPRESQTGRKTCAQCGEYVPSEHVYCPNCGEKAAHRVFCECGDELRSDWSFCPGCGRRTPAADVLDGS